MNNVIENLEYLVRRHDCVVIPSWGAFIARCESARYDEPEQLFFPPRRQLLFNATVDYDDGLLTSSVARHLNISFNAAKRIVDDEVAVMKRQFDLDGELSLGNVGRLIRQSESTPLFEPSESLLAFETFCMQPVKARLLTLENAEDAEIEITEEKKPARFGHRERGHKLLGLRLAKVAGAVVVTLALATTLILPSVFNRNDNLATMSPMQSISAVSESIAHYTSAATQNEMAVETSLSFSEAAPAPELNLTQNGPVVSDSMTEKPAETIAEAPVEAKSEVKAEVKSESKAGTKDDAKAGIKAETKADATTDTKAEKPTAKNHYCLVVASLANMNLAEKYIREDGNADMKVYAADGKYRVYVAAAPTSAELESAKAAISATNPDAWICRMK